MAEESVIRDLIHRSAEALYSSIDAIESELGAIAELVTGCLLTEGKVFACGDRSGSMLAAQFVTGLMNRLQHERPALPAINLSADSATISAICNDSSFTDVFERQVKALGQPGDLLLLMATEDRAGALLGAIRGAHEREMQVIVVSGAGASDQLALLTQDDILLQLPIEHSAQLAEVQLVVVNALLQLVEMNIFGLE